MESYIKDKRSRDASRAAQENDGPALVTEPESSPTEWQQDPVSGWWTPVPQDTSQLWVTSSWTSWSTPTASSSTSSWEGWNEWLGWHSPWDALSSSSSSTTSTSTATGEPLGVNLPPGDALPNDGLFPHVRDLDYIDFAGSLELTGAERRRLQEVGVSESMINRLGDVFLGLNHHQLSDRGPEGRWALARFARRADEGILAIDTIMELIHRRLTWTLASTTWLRDALSLGEVAAMVGLRQTETITLEMLSRALSVFR